MKSISDPVFIEVIISFLGLIGFLVSRFIYEKKHTGKKLVCLLGFDCEKVIKSKYSVFLGAKVESMGMIYYTYIYLAYMMLLFIPYGLPVFLSSVLLITSFMSFVFSLYLVYLQFVKLKSGCTWCLSSFVISSLIFLLVLCQYDFEMLLNYL